MQYLLDTNVWIDIERGDQPEVVRRSCALTGSQLLLSTVVLGEIQAGIERSRRPDAMRRVYDLLLHGCPVVEVDRESAVVYGKLRADLLNRGQVIGSNDLWIAAQAIRNDLVLVTANTKEFARVPNLKLENWR